jgi:Tol biopolymer transport system component
MQHTSPFRLRLCLAAPLAALLWGAAPAAAANVTWSYGDQVTACPAGDSTFVAGHPSRLRIVVNYSNALGAPRNLVPPESIWVNLATTSGNVIVNDATVATIPADQWSMRADDSTRAGAARITVPSLSGCGTLRATVWVSGVSQGTASVTVRGLDTNADGRVTSADVTGACDLDYNGFNDDGGRITAHDLHWHRNALFGSLLRVSSLCDTCSPGTLNSIGDGDLSWSPDGGRLAFSSHQTAGKCKLFYTSSVPGVGEMMRQFTFPSSPDSDDYDPSWSALGTEIVWDRHDRVIYRKGIPGLAADTSMIAIYGSSDPTTEVAISPDGKTVAFIEYPAGIEAHVYTVPITGGARRQITNVPGQVESRPKWSPSGDTLIFDRAVGNRWDQYFVPINVDPIPPATLFHSAVVSVGTSSPSYSPDGAIVTMGDGSPHIAYTFDARAADPAHRPGIANFPDFTYAGTYPRYSPDGTRIGLLAFDPRVPGAVDPQLWAARRNMNLPPSIGTLAGVTVRDSMPVVDLTIPATQLTQFSFTASDPEGDSTIASAYFLNTGLGMSFTAATRTFSWIPPYSEIGHDFNVRFQVSTASGGTDYAIARIHVTIPVDLVLQNLTIADTRLYEASHSITAGPAVTVASGGDATFHALDTAGPGITLADGFNAVTGSSFRAYVGGSAIGPTRAMPAGHPDVPVAVADAPTVSPAAPAAMPEPAPARLEFALEAARPNPMRGTTSLAFVLPAPAQVRLVLFDLQGRQVRTFAATGLAAGRHQFEWNGTDDSGSRVAPGIYLYRLQAGSRIAQRKLVLVN